MQKTGYLIFVVVVVIAFILFLFMRSGNQAKKYREEHRDFLPVTAKVTGIRQTSPGIKRTVSKVYAVTYTTSEGRTITDASAGIGRMKDYQVGDTLQVYYDPVNPGIGTVDKDGLEMDSNIFDRKNILVYVIGFLAVAIFLVVNFRKK